MADRLDRRLAGLILTRTEFTADDVTDDGRIAVDPAHAPNSRQSTIGSHFRDWSARGLIVRTGRVVRSRAPRRKGGMIQVWARTDEGVRWARGVSD